MAALGEVRAALAARLKAVYGGSMQVTPQFLSNPVVPGIDIFPDVMRYHLAAQGGASRWNLTVRAIVATNSDVAAQDALDAMLVEEGPQSLKEAIEGAVGAQTLGGLVSDVTVQESGGYRLYELPSMPGADALGAQWTVEILV